MNLYDEIKSPFNDIEILRSDPEKRRKFAC